MALIFFSSIFVCVNAANRCPNRCSIFFNSFQSSIKDLPQKDLLSDLEIMDLFYKSLMDPVTKVSTRYLPYKGGGCFSIALVTHLYTLKMGVSEESIHRVWVYGNTNINQNVVFNVAIVVYNKDGNPVVIDPSAGKPMNLNDWLIRASESFNLKKELYIRITAADRVINKVNNNRNIPTFNDKGWVSYKSILESGKLENPYFKGYFKDLFWQFVPLYAKEGTLLNPEMQKDL